MLSQGLVLSAVQTGAPAHFAHVYQAFHAGFHLYKGTVVGHGHNFTLHGVTHLEVRGERLPRVRSKLLETQGNALLLLVEVQHDHVDFLGR